MELTQVKPVSIKEFIVRNLTKLANVIYPCMTLRDKYVRFVSKYDFSKSMHCFDCAFGTNLRILQRGMVDTIIKGEFENKKYSIFASYDKLLRLIYGDYMQLPPVEEREPKHNFTAYMND